MLSLLVLRVFKFTSSHVTTPPLGLFPETFVWPDLNSLKIHLREMTLVGQRSLPNFLSRGSTPHGTKNGYFIMIVFSVLGCVAIINKFKSSAGVTRLKPSGGSSRSTRQSGWMSLVFNSLSVRRIRDKSAHGIFSINFWGATHNLVYTPLLIQKFSNLRSSVITFEPIEVLILIRCLGFPKQYQGHYIGMKEKLHACLTRRLLREPCVSDMSRSIMGLVQNDIPNLVSFSDNAATFRPWERLASPSLFRDSPGGDSLVEVSMFPLLWNFSGRMTLPVLLGEAFLANYPTLSDDFYNLDSSFPWLIPQLPHWLPIPALQNALSTRNRLQCGFRSLYLALDKVSEGNHPGPSWGAMCDVSEITTAMNEVMKGAGLPLHARAAIGLAVSLAMLINMNSHIFWMLLRILATPGFTDKIRQETAHLFEDENSSGNIRPLGSSSNVTKKPDTYNYSDTKMGSHASNQDRSPSKPTETTKQGYILGSSLGDECPLLKACYLETIRLDANIQSNRKIVKDFKFAESDDAASQGDQSLTMTAGSYIHALHYLHHTDPVYFEDPNTYRPERFLRRVETNEKPGSIGSHQTTVVDQMTLRPYGSGNSVCIGRVLAERVCLYLVASILHTWDIQPADLATGWVIPGHISMAGVCSPDKDVRAKISLRKCL